MSYKKNLPLYGHSQYSRIFIWFLLVSLACTEGKTKQEEVHSYPVTTVAVMDTFSFTDYVAEIKAVRNVEIRARVGGYLEKIFVDEGKLVDEGQMMFATSQTEHRNEVSMDRASLKSAEAEAKSAELQLKNIERLESKNVVSKTEAEIAGNKLLIAQAKVEEARARLFSAETNLSYTQIKAPFSGVVNKIPNKRGSLIEPGTLLTTLSDNHEIFAYFDVSEREYLSYALTAWNDSNEIRVASLILANGQEHPIKGRIETMEGEIEQTTGNIAFRARFSNPNRVLKHGASGKVRLKKQFKKVLLIPQKATFELQDKVYVYVVDKAGKLVTRQIKIQGRIPHLFVVSEGLKPGENILYEGLKDVRSGDTIRPEARALRTIFKDLSSQ